jgi:iron complex transport system substrate-binding protein
MSACGPREAAGWARMRNAKSSLRLALVVWLACVPLETWHGSAQVGPAREAAAAPRRIISLIPAVTEIVYAIGAGPRLVAVGTFDRYPPEVASLPRVGGLLDPDVERILSLKPDLVIVYGTQTDLRHQLERAGVEQFSYKHGGLASVMTTIRELGARLGRGDAAKQVADDLEARLGAIRTRVSGRPRPRTLLVFGREAMSLRGLFASGGVGFLHDMLETAGGTNVFTDVKRESVQMTTELILQRAPEVIVELRESVQPNQINAERAVWNRLASVPAIRDERVFILSDPSLTVPGPRVGDATDLIARTLHPKAFQ